MRANRTFRGVVVRGMFQQFQATAGAGLEPHRASQ
mgnify:CR=1 FL=1